jgi:outer membrane protein OmpA-like peptidoglycan-associated protein
MTTNKSQTRLLFLLLGWILPSVLHAQSVFYLEANDNFDGSPLTVEYRVLSVNSGKSYTIKNVEGLLFFELPKSEDIKIRVTRDGYYVEEKTIPAADLRDGETIRFRMEKRPTAKLTLTAIDGETGKPEPASFDVYFEGRMIGRGSTTRSQSMYELVVEQDGNYQVVVHAKSYDESRTDIPVAISSSSNTTMQTIPLFKPAKQIGVRLVDEQKGNPVKANVEIKLSNTGQVLFTGSPDNGVVLFTFENGKNYTITAESDKFNRLEKKIEGSQREDLILRLRPNTFVEFKVINKSNSRPVSAEVLVKTPSGNPVILEEMRFIPSERGAYKVEVSSPGFVTKTGSFTVNTLTGGTMEVLYELDQESQEYHVKIVDQYSKEVLDGLEFRVVDTKGQRLQGIIRNSNGEYVFTTDPAKEYLIQVSKKEYTDLSKTLVQTEKNVTHELLWVQDMIYTLTVVEPQTNQIVAGAKLEIKNGKGQGVYVYQTENGESHKARLAKNETYTYWVDAKGFQAEIAEFSDKSGNRRELYAVRSDKQNLTFAATDALTGEAVDAHLIYTIGGKKLPLSRLATGSFQGDYSSANTFEIEAMASEYKAYKGIVNSSKISNGIFPIALQRNNYLVKFKIENISDNQELRKVKLLVSDPKGNKVQERFIAKDGLFEATLQSSINYKVEAEKEGYEKYISDFSLEDLVATKLVKTFALTLVPKKEEPKPSIEPVTIAVEKSKEPIKVLEKPANPLPNTSGAMAAEFNNPESKGKRYLLSEVYFDQSSAQIRDEEVKQLNELAATLKGSTNLIIEIVGYTDNVGDPRRNLGLSQFRAKAVANYLFYQGADPRRIHSKGLGQELPVAENDNEENRAKNRRVELVLIEN